MQRCSFSCKDNLFDLAVLYNCCKLFYATIMMMMMLVTQGERLGCMSLPEMCT